VADLNQDGKLDIVTANQSTNTVSVLLGNGDGTFGPRVDLPVGPTPKTVRLNDVNGDGRIDIVVASSSRRSTRTIRRWYIPAGTW
jgi:hypothetical protein